MNRHLRQPAFASPIAKRSPLARGLVMAVLMNGGTTFHDSSGVAGPGQYTPALVSLTNGVNAHGKHFEFTATSTSTHIRWPNSAFVPTDGNITVSLLYERVDGTNRFASSWGIDTSLSGNAYRLDGWYPANDGLVYFQFGTTALTASGITFGADHWVSTSGPRGMEIWQNGFLRASNGTFPSRTGDVTMPFKLGQILSGVGVTNDLARYNVFCMWNRQLETREVWALSADPYAPWRNPV